MFVMCHGNRTWLGEVSIVFSDLSLISSRTYKKIILYSAVSHLVPLSRVLVKLKNNNNKKLQISRTTDYERLWESKSTTI